MMRIYASRFMPGFSFCILMLLSGCSTYRHQMAQSIRNASHNYKQLNTEERSKADSILRYGLDHEALYTLLADIKPISSIGGTLSYSLAKGNEDHNGQFSVVSIQTDSIQAALAAIKSWNKICKALSFGPFQFVLLPYQRSANGLRNFQILVCRRDLIDQKLQECAPFFAQWGFIPGSDLTTLLTAIEFENKYDRYRAYGHLFGYPAHAVDFFVEASLQEEKSGEFVKRNFFHIPVHAAEKGYFTYAIPQNYQPNLQDSSYYHQAMATLNQYRDWRKKQELEKNRFAVRTFLYKYWRKKHLSPK